MDVAVGKKEKKKKFVCSLILFRSFFRFLFNFQFAAAKKIDLSRLLFFLTLFKLYLIMLFSSIAVKLSCKIDRNGNARKKQAIQVSLLVVEQDGIIFTKGDN